MITRRDFISSAAAASLLPSFGKSTTPYDYEVEYLESTGTQYIDTGIELIESTDVTGGKIGCTVLTKVNRAYSAARKASESYVRAVGFFPNTTSVRFAVFYVGGAAGYSSYGISNIGELIEHEVNWSAGEWIAKNQQGNFATKNTDNTSIYLFATHGLTEYYSVMVGEFWLKRNGQLIIDLIPVVKDGKGMMYDKVSGQLFENKGTGDFIVGPRKGGNIHIAAMGEAKFSARSYVQDGLATLWDGIENAGWGVHDDVATSWKDLARGTNLFVLPSGVTWSSDGLNCTRDDTCIIGGTQAGNYMYPLYTSPEVSYEVVFRVDGMNESIGNAGGTIGVAFLATSLTYGMPWTTKWYVWPTLVGINNYAFKATQYMAYGSNVHIAYTVSQTNSSLFFNGQRVLSQNTSGFTHSGWQPGWSTRFNMAAASTARNGIDGKFYRIAAYTKALTDDEIASNYAIDKARFNLQ